MKDVAANEAQIAEGRGDVTTRIAHQVSDSAGSYFVQTTGCAVEVRIADVIASNIDSSGPSEDFTYLDIGSVDRERKAFVAPNIVSLAKAPSRAKQKVEVGDVLVSMTRPNLNAVARVTRDLRGAIASTGFHVLRSPRLEPDFLYYLVQTDSFVDAMCAVVQGALYPAVRPRDIEGFKFRLPPRAEQTRIVEKLKELLSDLDAGVAELQAAQRKLAQYRQSLLKAAVEGALTADWRAARHAIEKPTHPSSRRKPGSSVPARRANKTMDSRFRGNDDQKQDAPDNETGTELLQRILTERRARWETSQLAKFAERGKTPPKNWQAKYKEPVAPDTTDLPQLPEGWVWASLGQLIESLTSGSRDWASYYDRGTCTFVMAQNVRPWRPDFSFRQFVDPPIENRDRARSAVEKNDLLVTIVGANTGQVCRVPEQLEDHFVCQSVGLIRLVDKESSEFINAVLNSSGHGQRQFREMNYGAGRPHLSFDQLESVIVPLPSRSEQREILIRLEIGLAATKDVETQMLEAGRFAAAQRKNILKAAFAGQLVPQDPNDEPASALLERIRAERVSGGAKRSGNTGRKSKGRA